MSSYGYGYGGGHAQYAGGVRDQGDVAMRQPINPTAMQALESAVALPGVFTAAEMHRTLRRNNHDVMKTALQLREKHQFRQQYHYDQLNIGMTTIQMELKKGYVHLLENASDITNCPIVLLMLKHFKPSFSDQKTQLKGVGTVDGTSTLEDTRRTCVYLTDLAVEIMEENKADGIVFMIDLDGCSLGNLDTQMHTDILQMMKTRYPEIVKHVLVINGTTITRGLTHVLMKLASEKTQQRIRILSDLSELRHYINPQCIPQMYGGSYRLMMPLEWMKLQAELEEVDLESHAPAEEEKKLMTKDARQLNGMQYAACSVDQVVEMKTSVIRGPLYRNKSGLAWVKMYGILRPEALLLYEDVTSKMPQIIIPVNDEVSVHAAQFHDAPRNTFGFRVDAPGVAGGYLLAAGSEPERGKWLQEIQMNIDAMKEQVEIERREEERRMKEERAFAALNMISFDEPAPAPPPQQSQPQPQYQQQMRPPAPVMAYPQPSMEQKNMFMGLQMNPMMMMQQQVRAPQPTGPINMNMMNPNQPMPMNMMNNPNMMMNPMNQMHQPPGMSMNMNMNMNMNMMQYAPQQPPYNPTMPHFRG